MKFKFSSVWKDSSHWCNIASSPHILVFSCPVITNTLCLHNENISPNLRTTFMKQRRSWMVFLFKPRMFHPSNLPIWETIVLYEVYNFALWPPDISIPLLYFTTLLLTYFFDLLNLLSFILCCKQVYCVFIGSNSSV